jgi:2-polyprenyl-3-methyl-5-hydroxy-6-metoxy-1,4-benzoquinol methylase/uncharacterized protein YbaR (Trm112 family)
LPRSTAASSGLEPMTSQSTHLWVCPVDQGPLGNQGPELRCEVCDRVFPVTGGMPELLDPDGPHREEGEREIERADAALRDPREWLRSLTGVKRVYEEFSYEEELRSHHRNLAPFLGSTKTLLDVGCGVGMYAERLAPAVGNYLGVDLSLASLRIASACLGDRPNVSLARASAFRLPVADDSVDLVICSEVIEHVPSPHELLREAYRVLRPGGRLGLSTPNAYMMLSPVYLYYALRSPQEYRRYWRPEREWATAVDWHPAVRPSVLARWLRDSGFAVEGHFTSKWHYYTPTQPATRLALAVERAGGPGAAVLRRWLSVTRAMLRLPVLRWLGTRQYVLAAKPDDRNP